MVAAAIARARRYYAQNWRGAPHFSLVPVAQTSRLCMSPLCAGDVSAILTDEGSMVEWVKYSAYGVPFGLPAGDTDSDGDYDGDDKGRIGSGAYDVRKDVNLDGVEDSDDVDQGNAVTGGNHALGRGVLSAGGPGGAVGNRRGYAGYEYAPELEGTGAAGRHLYHVRNRVYDADVGRWTRRDPLGYVDGMGLYEYVKSHSIKSTDPYGLLSKRCGNGGNAISGWPDDSPPVCDAIPEPPAPPLPLPPGKPAYPWIDVSCGGALTAFWTPAVQEAFRSAVSACWGTSCGMPKIKCSYNCRSGTCGYAEWACPPVITICTSNIGGACDTERLLIHELIHARQICQNRTSRNCNDYICSEIEAYMAAGQCRSPYPSACCSQACTSAYADTTYCWSSLDKCMDKCAEITRGIGGSCSRGRYILPPPPPIPMPDPCALY